MKRLLKVLLWVIGVYLAIGAGLGLAFGGLGLVPYFALFWPVMLLMAVAMAIGG